MSVFFLFLFLFLFYCFGFCVTYALPLSLLLFWLLRNFCSPMCTVVWLMLTAGIHSWPAFALLSSCLCSCIDTACLPAIAGKAFRPVNCLCWQAGAHLVFIELNAASHQSSTRHLVPMTCQQINSQCIAASLQHANSVSASNTALQQHQSCHAVRM